MPEQLIAIYLDPGTVLGRDTLAGIARYARTVAAWHLVRETGEGLHRRIAEARQLHGVLGHLLTPHQQLINMLQAAGVPAVNLSNRMSSPIPSVVNDDVEVGRVGAEHLLGCGFRTFAYVGFDEHTYSQLRSAGFRERITAAGFPCRVYAQSDRSKTNYEDLLDWLPTLSRPVGIMACNDIRAVHISNACRELKLRIPDEVAVLGVDNDPLQCELVREPISSIALNWEEVGYLAAQRLHRLMEGKPVGHKPLTVPPQEVIPRRSTDVRAVGDPVVAKALALIRDHACDPIRVSQIVEQLPISRRPLEVRFRKVLGRTLHDEIRRVQFERAKAMLGSTDMTVLEIALSVGFKDHTRFTAEFRKTFGQPPSAYRATEAQRRAREE